MKEVLLSEDYLQHTRLRQYINYLTLILRELKSCKMLSDEANHCWELWHDLSKFDAKRFIDISIKKIRSIFSESKIYRTIQQYLSQLAGYRFITINKNCDSYVRIENSYSIKVADFNITKLKLLRIFEALRYFLWN